MTTAREDAVELLSGDRKRLTVGVKFDRPDQRCGVGAWGTGATGSGETGAE